MADDFATYFSPTKGVSARMTDMAGLYSLVSDNKFLNIYFGSAVALSIGALVCKAIEWYENASAKADQTTDTASITRAMYNLCIKSVVAMMFGLVLMHMMQKQDGEFISSLLFGAAGLAAFAILMSGLSNLVVFAANTSKLKKITPLVADVAYTVGIMVLTSSLLIMAIRQAISKD